MTRAPGLERFDARVPEGTRVVDDPAELVEFYSDARGAHLYAIADTAEPFWSVSRWYRRDDAVVGLVGLGNDMITLYAVSTKDPVGCLELTLGLACDLPSGTLLTGPTGLAAAIRPVREASWDGAHMRYELLDRAPIDAMPAELDSEQFSTEPLDDVDADELLALYATEPGAAFFQREMLRNETFVGVRRDGVLVAAAGTHVASDELGVAAIGAVYVRPDHRGHGLGRTVTAGVVRRLGSRVSTVGLNVSSANGAAIAVYEGLGFHPVLDYDESELA